MGSTFTDRSVRGLKPRDATYEVRDAGCPGLVLRVNTRGAKIWDVVVSEGGNRKRKRLGTFPDLSLKDARRLASEAKATPSLQVAGLRLRNVWAMYAAERRDVLRSFEDVETCWNLYAEPLLGNVRLEDLTMRHGAELIAHVAKAVSPLRARKVVRNIAPMLRYAAGRGLIPGNPWAGLYLPPGPKPRERVLTRSEWQTLWRWSCEAGYPFGTYLQALMLTGQRKRNVASMRWADISEDVWTLPPETFKSGRTHEVMVSGRLRGILAATPRTGDFVFSTRPGTHLAPGDKLKTRIDTETGITGWWFHDIRRSGATFMGDAGVPRFTIERVLGHADNSVTAIYDRSRHRDEKRAAMEALAATVIGGANAGKD